MYKCGWNVPGEEPEEDLGPFLFDTWLEARLFLLQEFSWLVLEDENLAEGAVTASKILQQCDLPSSAPVTFLIGSFVYWIRKSVEISDADIRGVTDSS